MQVRRLVMIRTAQAAQLVFGLLLKSLDAQAVEVCHHKHSSICLLQTRDSDPVANTRAPGRARHQTGAAAPLV
jgi:hypothetical protein